MSTGPSRPALGKIDQKNRVPRNATILAGVVTATFYTLSTLLLDSALTDTIAALGIIISWYYGITAFACVWYFRRELFSSWRAVVFKLIFPLTGGLMLLGILVASTKASMDPESGSGAALGGIGVVFFLGFGVLLIGVVLMMISRMREPTFFTGGSLTHETPALTDADIDDLVTASDGLPSQVRT